MRDRILKAIIAGLATYLDDENDKRQQAENKSLRASVRDYKHDD